MGSLTFRLAAFLAVAALSPVTAEAQRAGTAGAPTCEPAGTLNQIAELNEGSGLAASRTTPGRFWSHNDSGQPVVFALDSRGAVVGRLQITSARLEDWEAIAVGPCPDGSCIYIGDIGDNDAERRDVTIYRVAEPAGNLPATSSARAEAFRFAYPDGPQDAETLLVVPSGDVVIVTKGRTRGVALYRGRIPAAAGATATLERIGTAHRKGKVPGRDRITDGTVSPNGEWIALRTNTTVTLHRTTDLLAGNWKEAARIPVKALGEPQGEGISFGDDRTIFLVGEGGKKTRPGTFGRLACVL